MVNELLMEFNMPQFSEAHLKPRESLVTRQDFELACIREFSHSGHHLGVGVSPAERRERIRAAILREKKESRCWQDSGRTYAEIFTQAYQRALVVGDGGDKNPFGEWRADLEDDDDAI